MLGLGFLVFLPLAKAQESHQMTLEEAIDYGLSHNVNIENARFDAYIARAQAKEVIASGLPQITGKVEPQAFLQLPITILPGEFSPQQEIVPVQRADGGVLPLPVTQINPETGTPIAGAPIEVVFGFPVQFSAGVSLSQLVFDGSFFLGVKAAKSFEELAYQQVNRGREDIALAITQAYFQTLITRERISSLEANLTRLEQLYKETSALNQEGFAEKIDVDRLKISLGNLYLEREKANRLANLAIDILKYQMGMPYQDELELSMDLETLKQDKLGEISMVGTFDPTQRIEYQLLESQRELESLNLRGKRVGYLPSIYLFGNYQYQFQGEPNDETDNPLDLTGTWFPLSVVGLTVNVPIFDGLRREHSMEQSRLELKKIENQFELFEQSSQLEYRQAQAELNNAFASLKAAENTRDLAESVFNTTRIKYREGVGSSLEVNEAESQLSETEANYLSALLEYLLAQTEADRVMGEFSKYHE